MGRKIINWSAVQATHDLGSNRDTCCLTFGFRPAAWYKAIRRGKLRARLQRRPDWRAVQAYYDDGHTFRECRAEFGFAAASWSKAVRRGELTARSQRFPLQKILAEGKCRTSIKRRLLEAKILHNVCDLCGISEWRGQHLAIQIDHRNGVRDDHRLQNLRMLCPNCHSQTETFAARNRKKQSRLV